jgi:N-acetylglucosamine-6-phosphate deacetylase
MVAADFCPHGNLIQPDRLFSGYPNIRKGSISAIDGHIADSAGLLLIEISDGYISSGLIDLHVHSGDHAVYTDGTADSVWRVNRAHLRRGTTSIFPMTTTGSTGQLMRMWRVREVRDRWSADEGAITEGAHLSGPYFADDKVGCHPVLGRRDPRPEEYGGLLASDIVRIASCAAERPFQDSRARCVLIYTRIHVRKTDR